MSITHAKVSLLPDGSNSSLVLPSDWNAVHVGAGDRERRVLNANVTIDADTSAVVVGPLDLNGYSVTIGDNAALLIL